MTEILNKAPFCCYCGEQIFNHNQATMEHLVPLSRGGRNTSENKMPCCKRCNGRRSNKSLIELRQEYVVQLYFSRRAAYIEKLLVIIYNIDYIREHIEKNFLMCVNINKIQKDFEYY